MHYRTLGRTGEQVSEIGFGGAGAGLRNYLGVWDPTQEEQIQLVDTSHPTRCRVGHQLL